MQLPFSRTWRTWRNPDRAGSEARFAARRSALLELAVLLGVLTWVLWTDNKRVLPRPVRTVGYAVLLGVCLGALLRQQPGWQELGLAPPSWSAGLGVLAGFTAASILALGCTGWSAGTIGRVERFPAWLAGNWLIDGLQQILLQVVLVPRLAAIAGRSGWPVSLGAAALFALLHAPNRLLVLLTAPAAFVWCEWFRRYRNLAALWTSHVLLAAATLYCLDGPELRRLRVGISYIYHSITYP